MRISMPQDSICRRTPLCTPIRRPATQGFRVYIRQASPTLIPLCFKCRVPSPFQVASVATATVRIPARSQACLPYVRAWLTHYAAELLIHANTRFPRSTLISFPDARMGLRQRLHAALSLGQLVEGITVGHYPTIER